MKTEKNILIAFILNMVFAAVELVGGVLTGSIALASDAIHDLGDGISIGISYFLEKKSKNGPDEKFSYGHGRFSVLGGLMVSVLLLFSSLFVIYHAVLRMITPRPINYNGMIPLAMFGVCVNFAAAWFTHGEGSMNQKAVNLHMLEDVFGWMIVLIGAMVMKFTDFVWIDPLLSVGLSIFMLIHAWKNIKASAEIFLQKVPRGISIHEIKEKIMGIDGVMDVGHLHVWSLDGHRNVGTLHIAAASNHEIIEKKVREMLLVYGVQHVTLELEEEPHNCQCVFEDTHPVGCHCHC